MKLAPLFKMETEDAGGVAVAGRQINIPILFRLPALRPPDVVISQSLTVDGIAEVDCRVTPPNTVDNCFIVRATPPGIGIETIALEQTAHLKVNTAEQTRIIQRFILKRVP